MTKGEKISVAMKKRWAVATKDERRQMGKQTADDPDEFWRRVDKNGPIQPHMKTRCWVWLGTTRGGYGRFTIAGKYYAAHVHAFVLKHGPLLPGQKVLHQCDHRPCVRHLFSGTQHENILDSVAKGRHKNPVLPGENNPAVKLTEAQVSALRAKPPQRYEKTLVASQLGISHRTLNKILQGTRWRVLPS